jgi:hypothetical protein
MTDTTNTSPAAAGAGAADNAIDLGSIRNSVARIKNYLHVTTPGQESADLVAELLRSAADVPALLEGLIDAESVISQVKQHIHHEFDLGRESPIDIQEVLASPRADVTSWIKETARTTALNDTLKLAESLEKPNDDGETPVADAIRALLAN